MRLAQGGAAVAAASVALAAPATASAHGLTGRADLPIPIWLFSWAAAAVMVISFAALALLRSSPRLAGSAFVPLSPRLGRVLTSRALDIACGTLGGLLLALVIAAGLAGAQVASQNLAPTFVYVVFWLGLIPLSVLFGDVFKAFNPWRSIGRLTGWLLRGLDAAPLAYPRRLGYWPAALGLLAFAALELVSPYGDRPATIAVAALVYSAVTWLGTALFGVDVWCRRGEAFGVYFNLYSRLSVLELRAGCSAAGASSPV